MYPEQQQIYWHSGLYLQPQHFQSLDLHNEWQQSQLRRSAQPYNQGMIDLKIHKAALLDFVASINSVDCIMPGGTYLAFPGNCRIEKRNFRDAWKQRDQPFTLWLALRRFDPQHNNVTILKKEHERAGTRWVNTNDDPVMKDVYDQAPEATVARLCYNVRILTEEERLEAVDCECIPLARLLYENDTVIHDPHFAPPAVTLYGSAAVGELIETIYYDISARAKKLEEYKRSERLVNGRDQGDRVTQLLAMRTLNGVLPLLKNLYQARQTHPWQVYCLLCQLVGELSSFNEGCSFLGEWRSGHDNLQAYDHNQLLICFNSVRKTLASLLNSLVLEDNVYITMEKDANGVFASNFEYEQLKNVENILLLLRSSAMPMENKGIKNTGGIKLASAQVINLLIQHALPGTPVTLCPQAPRGVPNRSDSYYFMVDRRSELWATAEQDKSVSFYWPDMPEDLQVQLIFVVPT
jgi:type VI secretion system protein ImpJ